MGSGGSAATGSYDYVISKIGKSRCDERLIERARPGEDGLVDDAVERSERLC